jgi:hypothetical protein
LETNTSDQLNLKEVRVAREEIEMQRKPTNRSPALSKRGDDAQSSRKTNVFG